MTGNTHKPGAASPKHEALAIRDEYPMLLLCARTRVELHQRGLIELPATLSGLYYLVRPARLAQRPWSRTIHRGHSAP
jgi:hypothetical protein